MECGYQENYLDQWSYFPPTQWPMVWAINGNIQKLWLSNEHIPQNIKNLENLQALKILKFLRWLILHDINLLTYLLPEIGSILKSMPWNTFAKGIFSAFCPKGIIGWGLWSGSGSLILSKEDRLYVNAQKWFKL